MKKLDWNRLAKAPVEMKRGAYSSYKEYLAKAWAQEDRKDTSKEFQKSLEPILREKLANYMISRRPIKVTKPIQVIVDTLNKSGTSARYDVGTDQIPTGTTLVFDHIERSLKQWIFKSAEGKEYEIYDSPRVMYDSGTVVHNAGFYGLLYNTNIYDETVKELINKGK